MTTQARQGGSPGRDTHILLPSLPRSDATEGTGGGRLVQETQDSPSEPRAGGTSMESEFSGINLKNTAQGGPWGGGLRKSRSHTLQP